jgi:hypothetical protein
VIYVSEYVNNQNPNNAKSPFGNYKEKLPAWLLRQIEKGNRGRRFLAKTL